MPWYLILKAIVDYLKIAKVADCIKMGYPEAESNGMDKDGYTVVYVGRSHETNRNIYHGGEGTVTLEVGAYVNDNGKDFDTGYEKLSALESKVQEQIEEWASQDMPVKEIEIMEVQIDETAGNPYIARPTLGSFMALTAKWSKRTL